MPTRVQYKRTAGWTMPEGAIYAARGVGERGHWGNPFKVGEPFELTRLDGRTFSGTLTNQASAALLFSWWLPTQPQLLAAARTVLAGHDLVCWCRPDAACHVDVWLGAVNPRTTTPYRRNAAGTGGTITTQRSCNGCSASLGDATAWEMTCAIEDFPLPDVRDQCATCTPALTAAAQ